MGWKDYFYFERRDKYSIILLLILIILSGIIYFLVQNKNQNAAVQKEFVYQADADSLKEISKNNNTIITYYSDKLKTGETIELNVADTTELKKIPGIGSVFANRIVKYRTSLGGYASVDQLKEVWGVDEDLYNKIEMYLTVEGNPQKLKINRLKFDQLKTHPYLNYKQVKVIIDIRNRKGKIASLNRLALLEEFTDKDIERLNPYLSFD